MANKTKKTTKTAAKPATKKVAKKSTRGGWHHTDATKKKIQATMKAKYGKKSAPKKATTKKAK